MPLKDFQSPETENKGGKQKLWFDFSPNKDSCPEPTKNKCVIFPALQLARLLRPHAVILMFLFREMPAKTILVLVTMFRKVAEMLLFPLANCWAPALELR